MEGWGVGGGRSEGAELEGENKRGATGLLSYFMHLSGAAQMALAYRLDAISQGPKNSQFPGPNPLPLALAKDASKALRTGLYKS